MQLRRDRERGQHAFKDAPAAEDAWNRGPAGGGKAPNPPAVEETAALRTPVREAPPAAERPARPADSEPARAPAPQQDDNAAGKPRRGWLRRHPFLALVGLITLLLAAVAAYLYWDETGHFESTDDAFIAARQFAIAPKVAGYVTAVPVTDNQHVDKGGVIAQIDQRDYITALNQAQAQVTGAEAGIHNIDAQIATQDAQIAASQAQVNQAQANLELARVTWGRDQPLVNKGWATAQQGTTDVQNLKAQQAAVDSAQAALTVAQRQIDTLRAQRASAEASLAQTQAQLDQAKLNLSYTTVVADQPGRVVNLTGAVGQYAQAGTNLTMFVPDEIWVTANFKETQLDRMRRGQPVDMEIDAYPERDFHGHVDSVQPGSGTAFSLLPAENATGNYVKVVQRVPVKLILENPPADVSLGPGMSVVPTVRVDPAPSLYERLRAAFEQWWRRE
ncbi:MAG: efflux RND transporter periplasmic adaptor subunit [Hyphomicrobiales bacterium]|nr:efflux RND transporter periplasmic adaptor subunit [Hyphomicrobiales bacterium]